MLNMKLLTTSLFVIMTSLQVFAQEDQCQLTVLIDNITSIRGTMKIGLYDEEDGFMKKELTFDHQDITTDTVTFVFKGLQQGEYAITIYQDENNNGELDTNFLGIPQEPYAFSNNAAGRFGPPSFEDCKFFLSAENQEITISL